MILKILLLILLSCRPALALNWCDDANAVVCWLFDENTDPTPDSTGNGFTGAHTGDPTFATADPPAGGFSTGYFVLDGTNDSFVNNLTSQTRNAGESLSWTLWAYYEETQVNDPSHVMGQRNGSAAGDLWKHGYAGGTNDATFQYDPTGSGGTVTSTTDPARGEWEHLAGAHDGTNARIYLNGVLEGTSGDFSSAAIDQTTFRVGARADQSAQEEFTGRVDEASVFHLTLDATDINSIMDNGLLGTGSSRRHLIYY